MPKETGIVQKFFGRLERLYLPKLHLWLQFRPLLVVDGAVLEGNALVQQQQTDALAQAPQVEVGEFVDHRFGFLSGF